MGSDSGNIKEMVQDRDGFSERELTFTFAMLSPVRLSVVCLSVTLVHPTQAVQILRNISIALGTLAIL